MNLNNFQSCSAQESVLEKTAFKKSTVTNTMYKLHGTQHPLIRAVGKDQGSQ